MYLPPKVPPLLHSRRPFFPISHKATVLDFKKKPIQVQAYRSVDNQRNIFIYNTLMGKNKIDIKFIENDSERQRKFITRKPCVFKKARELSKLCGGRSCVIIDSPYEPHHEVQPPKEEAIEMVRKAEEMLPQQAIETQQGIAKLKQRNHEWEMAILMHEYMTCQRSTRKIGSEEARGLFGMAEERLRAVRARISVLSSTTAPIPAQEIPRIRESQEDVQEASQEQQGLSLRQFL